VIVTGSLPVDSHKCFVTVTPARALDSIQGVATLLPGRLSDILEKVPGPSLFNGAGIRLDQFIVVLDLDPPGVDIIAAGIGVGDRWDLLGNDKLVIGDIELTLLVASPFSAPQPYGAVTGTITFGGVPFQVETDTDGIVIARLTPGHVLDVSSLIAAFAKSIPADLPQITEAEVRVGPGKQYVIDTVIGGPWHVPAGPKGVAVGPVLLHLENTDPSGSNSPTGRIEGWADLFDVNLHLCDQLGKALELSATLPELEICKLLEEVAPSLPALPGAISSLVLADAGIAFASDANGYSVDVTADFKSAKTDFGAVELIVQKVNDQWEAALGFQLPDHWRLSTLTDTLRSFDGMSLTNTGFIASSFNGEPGFRRVHVPLESGQVTHGIRVASTLSLTTGQIAGVSMNWVGRQVLRGCDHAALSANLDADLQAFDIEASVDGDVPLGGLPVTFQ
jgi:hypothetical protein